MKKALSILLSMVLILTLFPLSGFEANAATASDPTDFYNEANWVEYKKSNTSNGEQINWGATTVTTVIKDGKNISAVKLQQHSSFNHLIKFAVDQNSKYTFSFDYKASATGLFNNKTAAIEDLGVAPLKNNALIYRDYTTTDPAAIYTITPLYAWAGSYDGKVTDSTVNTAITDFNANSWYSVTFEFETGNNQELEFFLNPQNGSEQDYLYLANINLEKQIKPTTTSEDLNNASNWATYNKNNVKSGWWGAPTASTDKGKSSIKVSSYNILTTATELTVEENTYYSISFEYCGSVKNPKALKTVGISTVTNGEIVHQTTGNIYNSGEVGDSTDWTAVSFEFNSGANTELEFFILPAAGDSAFNTNPLYLANFSIEKLEGLNIVSNWNVLRSEGTVINWMKPQTAYATKDGKSIHSVQIIGNSAGSYVSSFDAKQNHMYRLSFDYYSEYIGSIDPSYTPIFISCGVAPLNDGKAIYRTHQTTDPAGIFTLHTAYSWEGSYNAEGRVNYSSPNLNIKNQSADNWYNVSFEFSSGSNDKLEFYINPASLQNDAPINLANFKLEDLGAYTSADALNENKDLYNSCGSISCEEVSTSDHTKGFRLPYIGSGIEFVVNNTDNVKAGVKLPAMSTFKDYSATTIGSSDFVTKYHTLRMKVWVDGVAQDDVIINNKYEITKWFTVAEGLDPNQSHTIKLVRATEAALGNTLILMGVLSGDGTLGSVTTKEKPYIEVYGDSISSGYGNIKSGDFSNFNKDASLYSYVKDDKKVEADTDGATKHLNVSEYDYEDGTKTYAYLAAENLGADINVFSKSGLGITVYGGKADENTVTMAKWYPDLPKNKDADYVIINHITNDSKYYNSAAGLDKDELANKYCEFISTVRNDHEKAKIIVVYGMMSIYSTSENYYKTGEEAVLQAVATAKEKGDENVYALMLPKGNKGGAGHPDADEHLVASKLLTEFINGLGVIETENYVGIRAKSTTKGQGIRVKNNISKAEIESKNIVSYGAIAIRKDRMTVGAPLTFATPNIATGVAYNTDSSKFNGVVNPAILREETKDDNIFSCVLINIPQRYYGDKYSVRSFAIDADGKVYYGEVVEVSVFDVVRTILDPETPNASSNDKNTANNIVDEIIAAANNDPNNKITTYAQWCKNNGYDDYSTAAANPN